MSALSVSECRKYLGIAVHKTLMAGKHGALVSYFREKLKLELYIFK